MIATNTTETPEKKRAKASPEELKARALAWRFEEAERLAALTPVQRQYYGDLCTLRARRALEAAVPAYRILTNRQALELAETMPVGEDEVTRVRGMTPSKLLEIGAELVALARRRAGLTSA